MPFDPFETREAQRIIARFCKGKSTTRLQRWFEKIVSAEMTIENLHPGGVSSEESHESLALAEIIATGRGHSHGQLAVPVAAAKWLESQPPLTDELAAITRQAVEKIRSNSGLSAIAQEMGGWPAWRNYCRGLSTRLTRSAKSPDIRHQPKGSAAMEFLERLEHCQFQKDGDNIVSIVIGDWREQHELGDKDLEQITGFSRLKELTLTGQQVTDKGLPALSALTKLESLSIRGSRIRGPGFSQLELPRLKALQFGEKNVNAVLKHSAHFTGLRSLHVGDSDLTDEGFQSIAAFPKLESVVIDDCRKVRGVGFQYLAEASKLRAVSAGDTRLSAAGFEMLTSLRKLHQLHLRSAQFPAGTIAALGRLKALRSLDLTGCQAGEDQMQFLLQLKQLRHLALSRCPGVTDTLLQQIAQLPRLESLRIAGTPVTRAAEQILAEIPHLNSLDAGSTGLSRAALKRLDQLVSSRTETA